MSSGNTTWNTFFANDEILTLISSSVTWLVPIDARAAASVNTLNSVFTSSLSPNRNWHPLISFPVSPVKKSYIDCISCFGILAVVRINCTLFNGISRHENKRSKRSAISPPEEPLYICASSRTINNLFSSDSFSHSLVSSHIPASI